MVLDRGSTELDTGARDPASAASADARDALKDAADRYCIQVADA
jgi:hypothetical protein